jgi:CheY-like chemotaxis protein
VLEDLPGIAGDENAEPLVAAASRATRRGAELTSKLLAFSRRQLLQPSRIDTGGLVHSLADMLRRTLDQRVRIEVDAAPSCPPCLADAGQLESALLNIAINARDAMPDGGRLSFAARGCETLPAALAIDLVGDDGQTPVAADYVAIAITDTGSGMSESVRERAFEPFFTTKQSGRGTGLGLSTVYGFARQSRGGVTIDSTLGVGTTITLYIPRVRSRGAPAVRDAGPASGVPAGLRVLLVEDEPEVLRIALAFLEGWGCHVTPCASAEQALPLLLGTEAGFDLLLSDVVLGAGMRGTELAAHARRSRPALSVLLMSGYSSDLLAGEGAPPAASFELLRKPFSREELAAAVVAVTARSRPPDAGLPG